MWERLSVAPSVRARIGIRPSVRGLRMEMDAEVIRILGVSLMYSYGALFAITGDTKYGLWAILGAILMDYNN